MRSLGYISLQCLLGNAAIDRGLSVDSYDSVLHGKTICVVFTDKIVEGDFLFAQW